MANLFDSLGLKCEECGEDGEDETQSYKVVEKRHLCQKCAERLAHAILASVSTVGVKWPCPQHAKKEVEIYCRKCNVAMCHTCGLTAHSGHDMEDIMVYFDKMKEKVNRDIDVIGERQKETNKFLENVDKCLTEMQDHFASLTDKVSDYFEMKSRANEERRQNEIEKLKAEAEEKIKKILETRDDSIRGINSRVDSGKGELKKNYTTVLAELEEVREILLRKGRKVKASAESIRDRLDGAAAAARSVIDDCDSKALLENVMKLHEDNLTNVPALDEAGAEKLSSVTKKVSFKKLEGDCRVGFLTGKKASYEMVKTITVPSEICEPFLLSWVDERTMAIRDGTGSALYTINIECGSMETLIPSSTRNGIWDAAFLTDKSFAYSDYNTGIIRLCDAHAESERTILLPNDGSRFAYLKIDNREKLLAAAHNAENIYIIDPRTGLTLRAISVTECKPITGLDTLVNGDLLVRGGDMELFWLYRSSGATKLKVSLLQWSRRIDSRVGPDNLVYLTYRTGSGQDYAGNVSVISPDGSMRRENFIQFPTSYLYRYRPRIALPAPGTVVVMNGSVLLVYRDTPGVSDLEEP